METLGEAMQGVCRRQGACRSESRNDGAAVCCCRIFITVRGKHGKAPLSSDNGAASVCSSFHGICTSITPSALMLTWLVPASISGVTAASIIAAPFIASIRIGMGRWKPPLLRFRLTSL